MTHTELHPQVNRGQAAGIFRRIFRPFPGVRSARFPSLAAALLVPAAMLLNSCGGGEEPEPGPALTVATMKIEPVQVPDGFAYAGTIEGRARVTIGTKLMGVVASIPYEEGAAVRAGQVILSIRSDDLKAKRAQVEAGRAEAAAAFANISANYGRIRGLYERKSATQKEMDDMQMAFDMAKAKVTSVGEMSKEIDDMLRYADIASPIDGVVTGKFVEEGDLANPGMPLMSVEDTRGLRVKFSVPETEVGRIGRGTRVRVAVDASGSVAPIGGTVEKVNPSGDPASRQYAVEARIDSAAGARIHSGMYASVTVESATAEAIAVPPGVIVRRGQLDGVYVRTAGDRALLRWVRTGKTFADGRVEILSGLAGGEEVITTADPRLADGVSIGVER
jgi:RND family efflux transporter MFP subunit